MTPWTTPADLKAAVLKLWDRGTLARAAWSGAGLELPYRITLKGPTSTEWSDRFDEARRWIAGLEGLPLVWRDFVHPRLGANRVPLAVEWATVDDLLAFVRKKDEAARFVRWARTITQRFPALGPWVEAHPHRVIDGADDWNRLLDVVVWVAARPRPGVYLRQVDVPGVHTKILEARRGLLSEWLDLVLPPGAVDQTQTGVGRFADRYGFLSKPRMVRFRPLDVRLPGPRDLSWKLEDWAAWADPPRRLFITENETNYLALPSVADAWAVFGAGYGFEGWSSADWLGRAEVWYWGDLDTHGFSILDQLRGAVPGARSFLMDEATLGAHREFWGEEDQPVDRSLDRLTDEERAVYRGLVDGRWAPRLRLEQERIRFGWVEGKLAQLTSFQP